ncbi:MAG: FAD-dependent monooxygenase [Spirochaetia bacterium]|nr:FAD-dependent monooxygenase [Spirochaetia bacterium]
MLIKGKKIAIIGGGPGGLTLARLLQLKGVDVVVYERDASKNIRTQGGALDLHKESGLAALTKAGLLEAFKANFRPGADKIRIVDNRANLRYDEHEAEKSQSFGDKHFRPEIDRGPLRDILLDSLKSGTVVYASHLVSLEANGNSWRLDFRNGNSTNADIVIGADGADSRVRAFVTDIRPFYSGLTMVEGSVYNSEKTAPVIHALLKGGKIFAFGNEKTLIVSSKGDGSLGFATGCKTDESWSSASGIDFKDHSQLLAWFKNEFSEWNSLWHELFESETTIFTPRPQYCMPLDQTWKSKSNITVIGDAAHLMPPYAGEGVNMAMLDALELSEFLTSDRFKDTRAAISKYETRMQKRFSKVGEHTLFNTHWMHSAKALEKMLGMFGDSIWKKLIFISGMWFNVTLKPFLRRAMRFDVSQLLYIL